MAEFYIRSKGRPSRSNYAIGRDSGTLFLMISQSRGIIIVGKGQFTGREGQDIKATSGRGIEYLPPGTVIELIL
jgi:hypothetical protein